MKKESVFLLVLLLCQGMNAQIMKIYKGSTLIQTFNAVEADRVVFEPTILVQDIQLNQATGTLELGSRLKLTATVLPENAANSSISWTSSNPQVASVNDGWVTGKKAGKADIICEAQDGSGTRATCTITVEDNGMNLRVGFYETIPGYSVKDLKIIYNGEEHLAAENVFLYEPSKIWNFGKLTNFASAERYESGTSFIGRIFANATITNSISVAPETHFGALSLVASYTLIAIDGSNETIKVENVSVTIPENTVVYKSGYNCYLMFKISDKTTSYTNYPELPDPKDMFPMGYELIYIENVNGGQTR